MIWNKLTTLFLLFRNTYGESSGISISRIVSAQGSLLVDELGRARIFRGTNVVSKVFPYVPDTSDSADPLLSFNHRDVNILAEQGVTAIRLGVLWAGVEPTKGSYNQTYLAELSKIVRMCSDVGIYVLLDFHQDILSEKFCGQGVPPYIAEMNPYIESTQKGFPLPLTQTRYDTITNERPSKSDCNRFYQTWGLYEMTYAASYSYQQLYEKGQVRDAFIAFWTLVAKTFLPFNNILGYDIINEPFGGDIYADPKRLNPIYANKNDLQPFYDVVSSAIRAVDPNAIIHFESVTMIQKDVGFTSVPGGDEYASKSVFNFHYYSTVQREYSVNETIGFRVDTAKSLNCGAFFGEYEMGWGTYGDNIPNILKTLQAADAHLISATGWDFKDYVPKDAFVITGANNGLIDPEDGHVRSDFVAVFSRPYAHTIAGTPKSMEYIDSRREFLLVFVFNGKSGASGTTEIRGNFGIIYSDGYDVKVTDGFRAVFVDNSRIHIVPVKEGQGNVVVTFQMLPK